MPRLQLELPTIQNWNCHNCSGCCKQHGIFITEEEKERIESQNWAASNEIPDNMETIVTERSLIGKKKHRLAQQEDGSCVFLDEQGLCRIHGKFGEKAKPLACRIYPYAFHPKGNDISVSLRFSCPSVTQNLGKSITRQNKEVREIAELVVPEGRKQSAAPKLTNKVQLTWEETLDVVNALDESLADEKRPVALKLLRTYFWIDLIQKTNFKNIRGERLKELLNLLTAAAPEEVPTIPEPHPPSKVALMQFRLLAGQYARKDTFASMDTSAGGRLKQLKSATQLSSGTGLLPKLHPDLNEVPFEALEGTFGKLSEESEELFTRYFRVKIQGMHFCGPAYYNINLIDGLHALMLVFPATLWIARWRAVTHARSKINAEDVREALQIVDHQHGYSPVLGTWGSRKRVTTIAQMGDLQKLIVWYQR
ncbi:YkgJ family cysteine cluster protein [Thalassoglobus sp.]|uniref:YkgJ family cysteine cluster protein n=1 Tax=Thalassoglobus sp. TaxID=2795869 RepID=UPI003AA93B40